MVCIPQNFQFSRLRSWERGAQRADRSKLQSNINWTDNIVQKRTNIYKNWQTLTSIGNTPQNSVESPVAVPVPAVAVAVSKSVRNYEHDVPSLDQENNKEQSIAAAKLLRPSLKGVLIFQGDIQGDLFIKRYSIIRSFRWFFTSLNNVHLITVICID